MTKRDSTDVLRTSRRIRGCSWLALMVMWLLAGTALQAQTLSGRITDQDGQPVEMVSVVLRNSDKRPVAFTQTDSGGRFAVEVPAGKKAAEIFFNMMGYKALTIPVGEFKNHTDYVLQEQVYTLKEVRVQARKIRERGDTLSYNVLAFKQKQDRSIADVIAKMPGLSVNADGKISYEGKAINAYYIEGLDLLGGKYSLANENISADKVKSVEVIQNHQPIQALKGIRFSDRAALNIVLRDDAKNIWQGIADLGAGKSLQGKGRWLRDARVMEMYISPKMQSVSLLKTNNTGKDIEHEIADLVTNKRILLPEKGFLQHIQPAAPSLGSHRYRFNDSHVVATNWLFKTASSHDLRIQLSTFIDKTDMDGHSERTYFDTGTDAILITEDHEAHTRRNEWKAELLYKVNDRKTYLANKLTGYMNFDYSKGASILDGRYTRREVLPRKRYVADDLEFVRTLSNNRSISISSQFIYNYLPGRILLSNGLSQHLGLHATQWNTYTSFRHKIGSFNITYRGGVDMRTNRMQADDEGTWYRDSYDELVPYITPSVSYKNASLTLTAAGKTGWLYRRINGRSKNEMTFDPSLYGKYDFTSGFNTTLTYAGVTIPNSFGLLSEAPIYTGYITMTKGNGKPESMRMHTFSNFWSYRDVLGGFFANAGFTARQLSNATLYASSMKDGFYRREATERHSRVSDRQVSGKIGQSFGWGKLSLSASAVYGWGTYELLVNGQPAEFHKRNALLGMDFSFHPVDFFSVSGQSSMNHVEQESAATGFHSSLRYFFHQLKTYFMPGCWQIEWSNEWYHSNDKTVSNNFFSDVSIAYRRKDFELGLDCNNIFGTSRYERRFMTAFEQRLTVSRLRTREFVCKLCVRF